jgi:serine/threonine protein kinase
MSQSLGKYEIVGELGKGGMGVVYKALDPVLDRLVAIKTMAAELANNATYKKRFYREARAAAALHHPNIVTIYELGEQEGTLFIVMEFLEGKTLDRIIASGTQIVLPRKLSIIRQVGLALQFAHGKGIVHRDIKPANVMVLPDGMVKVVDFGIARFTSDITTQTQSVVGTLHYMSPEQLGGELVDRRSDIFALGVTIYEFLCGRHPFEAPTIPALITKIINADPLPIRHFFSECPDDLVALVSRTLVKNREGRYSGIDQLLADLEPILERTTRETADRLFERGRFHAQQRQWPPAQECLEQVVELDPARTTARTLLEHVRAQIERESIKQQLEPRVEIARQMMSANRYTEAAAECAAILRVDPSHAEARELLAQSERALERLRLARHRFEQAQKLFHDGLLTPARNEISKLLEMDSQNEEAQRLLQQIEVQGIEREQQRRLADGLTQAKDDIEHSRFQAADNLLLRLEGEFPADPEVARLRTVIRELLDREELNRWTQERLAEAQRHLNRRQYDQALRVLEETRTRNPFDERVIELTAKVHAEKNEHEKLAAERSVRPRETALPAAPPAETRVVARPPTAPAESTAGAGDAEVSKYVGVASKAGPPAASPQGVAARVTRRPTFLSRAPIGVAAFVIVIAALALGSYLLQRKRTQVSMAPVVATQPAAANQPSEVNRPQAPPTKVPAEVSNPETERPLPQEPGVQNAALTVSLNQLATLKGKVVDDQGGPLAGFRVRTVNQATKRQAFSTTDGQGNYLISGLAPGNYSVGVDSRLGYRTPPKDRVALQAAQTLVLTFKASKEAPTGGPALPMSGAVHGRVVDDHNNPVASAAVKIEAQKQGFVRSASSDAAGDFRFADLPADTYTLKVDSVAGFQPKTQAGITLAGGQDEEVLVALDRTPAPQPPTGSLDGSVTDDQSGPLGGVTIRLMPASPGEAPHSLTTDPRGKFSAENLKPGTYGIEVEPPPIYSAKYVSGVKIEAGQRLPFAVKLSEPAFRFAVSHWHVIGGCYGYLTITRQEIRYEVIKPAKDQAHGFRLDRRTLTTARQWYFGTYQRPAVELQFKSGKKLHIFHVRESALKGASLSLRFSDVLPWEQIADVAKDFDEAVKHPQQYATLPARSAAGSDQTPPH